MQISEYVEKFLIANPKSPIGSPSGRTNVHKSLLPGIGYGRFMQRKRSPGFFSSHQGTPPISHSAQM